VEHLDGDGARFFELVCEQNLEGIVCKPKTSSYPFTWIKVKNRNYTQAADRGEWFKSATKIRASEAVGRAEERENPRAVSGLCPSPRNQSGE